MMNPNIKLPPLHLKPRPRKDTHRPVRSPEREDVVKRAGPKPRWSVVPRFAETPADPAE